MPKICLDPGHGGTDPGAVNVFRYEKDDVLRLALAVKPLLEAQGIEVVMTRTDDSGPKIAERCALANKAGCDYFLSIHRDGVNDPTAEGFSVWVISTANEKTVEKARGILEEVLDVIPAKNRGCNKGSAQGYKDYGVNTGTNMASALLEMGFISSPADNERFDDCFDLYAAAICKGLCAAVGKSYITPIDLTPIMGEAAATAAQMRAYLKGRNPDAPDYDNLFLEEAAAEGVRGDIAFAQSCVETSCWRFGGDVRPEQNNFAGIGATGGGEPGNCFATPREGIRAQVQHLKCYASTEPLTGECVDPRWGDWLRGKAPYVEWLGSQENPEGIGWAGGKGYGAAILHVLADILATAPETPTTPPEDETVTISRKEWSALYDDLLAARKDK